MSMMGQVWGRAGAADEAMGNRFEKYNHRVLYSMIIIVESNNQRVNAMGVELTQY
jgi:hypothetical protein